MNTFRADRALRRITAASVLAAVVAAVSACGSAAVSRTPAAVPVGNVIAPVSTTTTAAEPASGPATATPTTPVLQHPAAPSSTRPATTPAAPAEPLPTKARTPTRIDPSTLDPGAWLPTDQLPLGNVEHWSQWYTILPPAFGGDNGFAVPAEVCHMPGLDTLGAIGAARRDAHDTLDTTDPAHNLASPEQDIIVFPDDATARKAYTALLADAQPCQLPATADRTGAGLHQTASDATGTAWARYPTPATDAGIAPAFEDHDYLVLAGPTLSFLNLHLNTAADGARPDPAYQRVDDGAVLAALGTHLAVYRNQ